MLYYLNSFLTVSIPNTYCTTQYEILLHKLNGMRTLIEYDEKLVDKMKEEEIMF